MSSAPQADTCCKPGNVCDYTATGSYKSVAGVDCYVTPHIDTLKYVVLNTDVWGHKWINLQKVADHVASECKANVIIPDLFASGAMDNSKELKDLNFPEWMAKNPVSVSIERSNKVVQHIIDEHKGKEVSIGVMGYCWGAKMCEGQLASFPQVKCSVWFHPSWVSAEEAEKIPKGKHMFFGCAEEDGIFTPELKEKYFAVLKKNGVNVEKIDYPHTQHGFASRPKDGSKQNMDLRQKAEDDGANFLKSHL